MSAKEEYKGHNKAKYMFDEENLEHLLESYNFMNVKLVNFEHEIDIEEGKFKTIYCIG
ncbi:MAG: hypothetical protein ABDH21_01275 [bacterium]